MLEAFLACPAKCHLLSKGEVPASTEYSAWAAAREESYRRESFRKLTSQETGPDIASAEPGLWKNESWRFAIDKTVRTETWEAEISKDVRACKANCRRGSKTALPETSPSPQPSLLNQRVDRRDHNQRQQRR